MNDEGLSHLIEVDSAGTHAYHVGSPPDRRSMQTASSNGIDLSYIRGRQVTVEDFNYFDYILAMDSDNYSDLQRLSSADNRSKIHLFLSFAPELKPVSEVPDPYYGGSKGFENVYNLIAKASKGLLADIEAKL